MQTDQFRTTAGTGVTAVTTDGMRDVDRVAVEEVGLTLPRMMEHAGRSLAAEALGMADGRVADDRPVVVLAGAGGNGGGGLVCARHLANRDVPTTVVLDREPADVDGVPGEQLRILQAMGVAVQTGTPRGRAAELIEWTDSVSADCLSLDIPSGVDATTGERPGVAIDAERTLTLALPKTGLADTDSRLLLADLSIPTTVYDRLDIPYESPFGRAFTVELKR